MNKYLLTTSVLALAVAVSNAHASPDNNDQNVGYGPVSAVAGNGGNANGVVEDDGDSFGFPYGQTWGGQRGYRGKGFRGTRGTGGTAGNGGDAWAMGNSFNTTTDVIANQNMSSYVTGNGIYMMGGSATGGNGGNGGYAIPISVGVGVGGNGGKAKGADGGYSDAYTGDGGNGGRAGGYADAWGGYAGNDTYQRSDTDSTARGDGGNGADADNNVMRWGLRLVDGLRARARGDGGDANNDSDGGTSTAGPSTNTAAAGGADAFGAGLGGDGGNSGNADAGSNDGGSNTAGNGAFGAGLSEAATAWAYGGVGGDATAGDANLTTGAATVTMTSGSFGGIANGYISTGIYNAGHAATNVAAHSNVTIGN